MGIFAFFSNEGNYLLRRKCLSHILSGTVLTTLPKIMSQLSGSMAVALVMEHLMPNLESAGGQTQMIKNGVSTTNTRIPISSRKFLQRKTQYEHSRNAGTNTFKFAQIQTISLTACKYVPKWIENGWVTTAGHEAVHRDALENILELEKSINVEYVWIPRSENQEADELARIAANNA